MFGRDVEIFGGDSGEGYFTKELLEAAVKNMQPMGQKPFAWANTYRTRCGTLLAEYMNRRLGLQGIPEFRDMSNYNLLLELDYELELHYKYYKGDDDFMSSWMIDMRPGSART